MVSGITSFGKFLWSGSVDRDFENRIGKSDKLEEFIVTNFARDNYTCMDLTQILQVMMKADCVLIHESSLKLPNHVCTIDNQVTLTWPNMERYKKIYKEFAGYAKIGWFITGAIAITQCAIAVLKQRSFAAIPFKSVALLSMCCMFLWTRARRADSLFNKFSSYEEKFMEYARGVQSNRAALFTAWDLDSIRNRNVKKFPAKKIASSSEIEICQLHYLHRAIQSQSCNSFILLHDIFINFDNSCDVNKFANTPELKAINTYLSQLTSLDWIQQTVGALKEAFTRYLQLYPWSIVQSDFEKISSLAYRYIFLSESQTIVLDHLNPYLKGRFNEDNTVVLPTKEQLAGPIKQIKERVKQKMLEDISKNEVILRQIPQDDPLWKQAGLNPESLKWVE